MRYFKYMVLAVLFLFLLSPDLIAAAVIVSWDANTEEDLAGYRVYCGNESGEYTSNINVGMVTDHEISGLGSGERYYFAVTAYDTSANESGYSEEISVYIPVPDTTPPSGSITINQGDDTSSSRIVSLGLTASDTQGSVTSMKISNDNQSWSDGAFASNQSWVLSENDGTKTVYVRFCDSAGNWMSSSVSDTITLVLDNDSDGMPDAWEVEHGLDPAVDDASLDSDNDGISNLEEYISQSDPCDASDNAPVARAVASAGEESEPFSPTRIDLDAGASSDPNGDALSFSWSFISGPVDDIVIENASSAMAAFMAGPAGTYRFMVVCSDSRASSTDQVDVRIKNVAPSVDAGGDVIMDAGGQTTLHAAGHDSNGDALSYQWTQTQGPEMTLSDMDQADVQMVFESPGQYIFSVRCSDGVITGEPDEMNVTINALNRAPSAVAGADMDVEVNDHVCLDASKSSDPDGDALSYEWTQVSGEEVELYDSTTASPWFDAELPGNLGFELKVCDAEVCSVPDMVEIRVLDANTAPVADAGEDIEVKTGERVQLDASLSYDPDADPLGYTWEQISGAIVEISDGSGVLASFIPASSGVYSFQVRVYDSQSFSTDTVEVVVSSVNGIPVADAGEDRVVSIGDNVQLDASQSYDPDADPLSFSWSQVEGPGVSLDSPDSVSPVFTPSEAGVYTFELRVWDDEDTSKADTVVVNVQQEPVVIVPQTPSSGEYIRNNPLFSWAAENINTFSLYVSLNKSSFYNVYSGSSSQFRLHPVLWYWFIPSGTTFSWYVSGETQDEKITSRVFHFTKR
ncbi:MAG: PKD domain-containing protein [Thermodesulfobacteriota bacterium]|nr:PKD domain-containing protein [Thermodesulfobacteriota bacterium]